MQLVDSSGHAQAPFVENKGRQQLERRLDWRLGLAVLVAALGIRVLVLLTLTHPEILGGGFELNTDSDEAVYHGISSAVSSSGEYLGAPGGQPTASRLPGSILPLALLYFVFGPSPLLATSYVVLTSCAVVVLLGALARQSGGGPRIQILAMLLGAVSPSLVLSSAGIWSDPPALLLTLTALYLLQIVVDRPRGVLVWVLLGATLSFAYLTRPANGVLIAFLLVLMTVMGALRSNLRPVAITAIVALAPVCIWGFRNFVTMGDFFVGSSIQGKAIFKSNNAVTAGLEKPILDRIGPYDLEREADLGMYLGRGVEVEYVLATFPVPHDGLGELEVNSWYQEQTVLFVTKNLRAIPKLIGYKLLKFVTAEPRAPSMAKGAPLTRRIRWAVAATERALLLVFGLSGLVILVRLEPKSGWVYVVFFVASVGSVLISHPGARVCLPAMGTLMVPASFSASWIFGKPRSGTRIRESHSTEE